MTGTRFGRFSRLRDRSSTAGGHRRSLLSLPLLLALLLSVSVAVGVSALHGFLDLQVYRVGTRTWMHHGALYGVMPPAAPGKVLPFTYPPTAAVLMTPLAVVPTWLAEWLLTAASLLCLAVTIWLILARIRPDLAQRTRLTVTLAVSVALLLIEPVRLTLWFGQVNLILMAAVALDCLTVKTRWPRGVLVGLAAVVKLTPAAFVLYFLIRRDWKAAATATATGTLTILAGFLLFPEESRQYWFHTVSDTDRIGLPDYVGNQSIKGLVIRLGVPHTAATVVWLGLAVIVIAVGAALMHRLFRLDRTAGVDPALGDTAAIDPAATDERPGFFAVTALLVNAAVLLLISPVSWTHHWVWVAPALVTAALWTLAQPTTTRRVVFAVFVLLFLIGPGLVPNGRHRELVWAWWEYIPGDAYIIAAAGVLIAGLVLLVRRQSVGRPGTLVPPA